MTRIHSFDRMMVRIAVKCEYFPTVPVPFPMKLAHPRESVSAERQERQSGNNSSRTCRVTGGKPATGLDMSPYWKAEEGARQGMRWPGIGYAGHSVSP
jgi:hypothetical protein